MNINKISNEELLEKIASLEQENTILKQELHSSPKKRNRLINKNDTASNLNILYSLFEMSIDAVLLLDNNAKILNANNSAISLLGYSIAEIKKLYLYKILNIESQDSFQLIWNRFITNGHLSTEQSINKKDGNRIIAFIKGKAYNNENINIIIIDDLTKQRTDELKQIEYFSKIEILSEISNTLINMLSINDLYDFIGKKLKEFSAADYLLVSIYNKYDNSLSPRNILGLDSIDKINNIAGFDLFNVHVFIHEYADDIIEFASGKIFLLTNGLYQLSGKKVPKIICSSIEKFFNIHKIYSMGLSWNGNIYGAITFFYKENNDIENKDILESIINQASLSIQRMLTQEALTNSEIKFRSIIEAANEGFWEVDANNNTILVNKKMADMLGYPLDEIYNTPVINFLLPDEYKDFHNKNIVRTKGIQDQYERKFLHKSGKVITTSVSASPKFDDKGYFVGSYAMFTDITERILFQEDIIQKNKLLDSINKLFYKSLFCKSEEEISLNCLEIALSSLNSNIGFIGIINSNNKFDIMALTDPNTNEIILASTNKKTYKNLDMNNLWGRILKKNGIYIINNISDFSSKEENALWNPKYHSFIGIVLKNNDKPFGIMGIGKSSDSFKKSDLELLEYLSLYFTETITRKNTEDMLRESEEKLRCMIEQSSDGIILIDSDSKIIEWNFATEYITGLLKTNVIGQYLYDVFFKLQTKEFSNPEYYEYLKHTISNITSDTNNQFINNHLIYKILLENSTKKTVEVINFQIKTSKDYLIGSFLRDITQQKEYEEKMLAKSLELSLALETKDKFFNIIAHDLRSPFSGFLGLFDVIVNDFKSISIRELHEITTKMYESANNLYKLLNNLLDWAACQTGNISFLPTKVYLNNIVNLNLNLYKSISEQKEVKLVNLITDDFFVFADEQMLITVIRNIINNAIKFSFRKGIVNINARKIIVNDKGFIEISIKDHGIGISPENLALLFDISVNIKTNGTDGEPSTGLGLVICKEFINKMGGEIWVDSARGNGAVFSFTIPEYIKNYIS